MKRFVLVLLLSLAASAALAGDVANDGSAEDRVRELYGLISVEPGGVAPDWTRVRSAFIDEAVIFMRVTREKSEVFTLDQWVADFETFVKESNVLERGFTEEIVRLHATEFRDVAEVMVLYEASFPTSTRPPQQGVDLIHLARIGGEWRIVSIVNDIPETPDQIPDTLKK